MTRASVRLIVLAAVVIVSPAILAAQPATGKVQTPVVQAETPGPMQPGMLVAIGRIELKPGMEAAFEKLEASSARLTETKVPGMPRALAMSAISGPSGVWFVIPLPSYGSIDAVMDMWRQMPAAVQVEFGRISEQEAPTLSSAATMICRYLHDYSNLASTDVSGFRFMEVTTYRVRQGRDREFLDSAKLYAGAMKKVTPEQPWALFELTSGGYLGTYLLFLPLKKMAELTPDPANEKQLAQALGPDGLQKMRTMVSDLLTSVSTSVFAFSPGISTVAPVYAKTDPWWAWPAAAPAKPPAATKKPAEPVKK